MDILILFSTWMNSEDIMIQAKEAISQKTNMLHIHSDEVFGVVTHIETEWLVTRLGERERGAVVSEHRVSVL